MWVVAGIPIYMINYGAFVLVLLLTKNSTMAYWSWIMASPLTLWVWGALEARSTSRGKTC
jgi:hypothetical protein